MIFVQSTVKSFVPADPSLDMVVLMSGGVDSAVTAMLMKEAGFNIVGVTMQIPKADGRPGENQVDASEAGSIAKRLDIPHYFVDVCSQFNAEVINPFRNAYLNGDTPSPCVDCNTRIKFTAVWDAARKRFGASKLATGHYARIVKSGDSAFLARGADHTRDQSYFLYAIAQENLSNLYLPLSEYTKDEVRDMAQNADLPAAKKSDSMELCFAGQNDYRSVLTDVSNGAGEIVDENAKVIGTHRGIHNYTVGQRKGIGVPAKEPFYVLRIEPQTKRVVVGNKDSLYAKNIKAVDINLLISGMYSVGNTFYGKIRSQGEPTLCTLTIAQNDTMTVQFEEPQFAPAPGQRLVLYDEEERVAVGGTIIL